MKKIAICLQFLFLVVLADDAFKIEFDKIEVVSYNKDIVEDPVLTLFQFNDSSQAVNSSGTLKQDLGMDIKVNMDLQKQQENDEFKVLTSVTDIDMCDLINTNQFGLKDLLQYGNFTVCPWKKAFYVFNNAMVDVSKLPPNAPAGKYVMNTMFSSGTTQLMQLRFVGTVIRK